MITVTDKAAAKIRKILETNDNLVGGMRIGLGGGGCSGLSYKFKLEAEPRPDDTILELGGVRVFIDPKSYAYLDGMTLDYGETLLQSDFLFHNPHAKSTCGCGKSFAI